MSVHKPPDFIPVDPERCQAYKTNGATFMTLGGRPEMVRCWNKPTVIATENYPASDGFIGDMSLCADCQQVCITQNGDGFASFSPIPSTAAV